MNLPNRLSVFRIAILPVFLPVLWIERILPHEDHLMLAWFHVAALVMVIMVAVSDYYDGAMARKLGMTSNLGRLLDPLADKVFMTAALIGMEVLGHIPAWIVIVILSREFIVTGLRSIAANSGRIIAADAWGKHKTGWQFAFLITGIVFMALTQFLKATGHWDDAVASYRLDEVLLWTLWVPISVTLFLTVWSGWLYIYRNYDVLE